MNVPIITKDGKLHVLSLECYTRWLCLLEALDVISSKAEEDNIDLEKDQSWIKPGALQKYMDERYHAMLYDIEYELSGGSTPYV